MNKSVSIDDFKNWATGLAPAKAIKQQRERKERAQIDNKKAPSKNGKNGKERETPPLPEKDPGFPMFAKWFSYPAYKGLFNWQEEHHELTWEAEFEETLVPRDHGKSVVYTEKYEWAMQYKNFDVLLLGWTDRRKEVAMYVYSFFELHDLIETDRRTSPFHFRIKNGGKFDCYLITSKETLGMHSEGVQDRFSNITEEEWQEFVGLFEGDIEQDAERLFSEDELRDYIESRKGSERKLWISIDDPISIDFWKERHKEESLELHFNSSLYGIHPDKWSFTGTRKFEGDFFDFINAKFGSELVKYVSGTRKPDGSLLCPERFTHPDIPTYKEDLEKGKWDLQRIRIHVGEYAWHSEYEQNPHPIFGEVWDAVEYKLMLDTPVNRMHDLCFITIDRATTTEISSNYTGCIIGVREIQTGDRIIINDFTDKIPLVDLLILINDFVIEFRAKHEDVLILLIVEKQGGGDDFITMARSMREFIKPDGTHIPNKIPEIAIIIDVHNIGKKIDRIKQRLMAPLKNRKYKFLNSLSKSEIVKEILTFPHSPFLDAIDSLANAEFILLTDYPAIGQGSSRVQDYAEAYKRTTESVARQEEQEKRSIIGELNTVVQGQKRKSVF